jgi:hypothetical protein
MNETTATEESPYLTVKQLAARFHTSPNAIYTARSRRRRFPRGFKNNGQVLFPIEEVEAYELANKQADSRFNTDLDPTRAPVQAKGSRGRPPTVPAQRSAA